MMQGARAEAGELREQIEFVKMIILTLPERRACGFIEFGDWKGLADWARERAQEADGGVALSLHPPLSTRHVAP